MERWQLAKMEGCDYIEVPADFVKNKTESQSAGLNLGDFIVDESAIARLYMHDSVIPQELKYILHTEPSLARSDSYGISYQAPLKWYNADWTSKLADMVVFISNFLGKPAGVIEIHPGDRRNSYANIASSIELLLDRYKRAFGVKPLILIENRTEQFISTGKDVLGFWQYLSEQYSYLRKTVGVVLDIQQLYTRTKANFLTELEIIPTDSIKGLHIHHKHKVPNISDEIPWTQAFRKIAAISEPILINPEVHHKNKVKDGIEFCENMLRSVGIKSAHVGDFTE